MLRKIECFLQPSKLDEVKNELVGMGVGGMSIIEVKGFGTQRGYTEKEVPNKEVKFLPKTKVEIVVDGEIVDDVIPQVPQVVILNLKMLAITEFRTLGSR